MGCGSSQPSEIEKSVSTVPKLDEKDRSQSTQPNSVNSRLDTQAKDSSAKPVYQSRVKALANGDNKPEINGPDGNGQEGADTPVQIESHDEEAEDDDKVMPLPNIPNIRATPRVIQPSFQPETNGVQWTNLYVNSGNHGTMLRVIVSSML